ncbi:hypothetical protein Tco_0672780 [Tanacetum coccineum]
MEHPPWLQPQYKCGCPTMIQLSRWGMQLAEIECTGRGRVDSMRRYEGTGGINEAAHATAAATGGDVP